MKCNDFDNHFDAYVDEQLDEKTRDAVRVHMDVCPTCESSVARYQQSRCLLKTAVAELASAVDVSGLWKAVEGELGDILPARAAVPVALPAALPAAVSVSWSDRLNTLIESLAPAFSVQGGVLAGSAAALTIAFLSVVGGPTSTMSPGAIEVASVPSSASIVRETPLPMPLRPNEGPPVRLLAAASATSPHVQVHRISTTPDHAVSTWVQPRTGARVIWVSDRDGGQPAVSTADFRR
jgi:hypothetical protein